MHKDYRPLPWNIEDCMIISLTNWNLSLDHKKKNLKAEGKSERLMGWPGWYWNKVHFNCVCPQSPAWHTDYDALLRQFVKVLLIGLVLSMDILISEDSHHTDDTRYTLIPSICNWRSSCTSHIKREIWDVINRTIDQANLFPFPVTTDSGILVRFPVAEQLKKHTNGCLGHRKSQ